MMPPLVLHVRVARRGRTTVALYLPLFALWPLAVPALMLVPAAAPLVALAARRRGYRWPVRKCAGLALHLGLICLAARGLRVEVVKEDVKVKLAFL